MGNFEDLFKGFMILGLVVLSLFSFISVFQDENDVTEKVMDDTAMNNSFSTIMVDLRGLESKAQEQKNLFEKDEGTVGFGSLLLKSILGAGKTFNSMVMGVWNALIVLPATVLGVDASVISVLSTLLMISIIFGLWVWYKLGG